MVTLEEIQSAMRIERENQSIKSSSTLPRVLAMTLRLYRERKEYDGTMNSAMSCLEQCCYDTSLARHEVTCPPTPSSDLHSMVDALFTCAETIDRLLASETDLDSADKTALKAAMYRAYSLASKAQGDS